MLQTQRSKLDADRLVESLKRKGNSGHELQLKGFHVASLYYQSKEYRTALSYCQNYVSAKPNDARAHKLLGQINEAMQNVPKAIEGYRRALELNDMQKDLILKVADLYCKVRCEPERHRYWAEKAEKYYPGHETVHKIREHIFRASGKLNELEQYLRAKLRSSPSDANLHVQLLKVLIEIGRLNDAKQLCIKVESSHLFDDHQNWWEQAISVYLTMLRSWSRDQSHHAQIACMTTYCSLLYAINRLVVLSLANPNMPTAQTAEILKRLDHDLVKANDCVASSQYSTEVPYAQITLEEMKAQMYYHVGTLLMKMAANNQVRWHDVMGMAAVSYLVSLQVTPQESHATSKNENLANLYKIGCSRLSEICHVLHGLVKQHSTDWLEECVEQWCNEEGRQQFLYQVFGEDSGVTDLSSLHVEDSFLLTNTPDLPDLVDSVYRYDEVSVLHRPSDPHRLVWLGLQWNIRQDGILPDLSSFVEGIFERLVFSTNTLDNISVDNIRLLDIEAFLYASVHVAATMLSQLNQRQLISKDLPRQRPLVLHRDLCSEEQLEWYSALHQLYSGKAKASDRAKLRLTAQKGLEVLRCRINHGMETSLLVQLGKTFHARMKEVQNQSDDPQNKRDVWQAYQRMSVLYWQAALEQLKLLGSDKSVPQQKKPFFPYQQQSKLETRQIQEYLDEGSVVVSEYKFQLGKHQDALDCIDRAKTPNALYTKAMMYKTLAGIQTGGRPEDQLNSSEVSQHGELLDKAKYALFATMDCIEDKPNHSLHEPVQEMLEEIEADQSHLAKELSIMEAPYDDSRISNIADISSRSNTIRSTLDFEDENVKEPSPRRLAAELRSMNSSHTRLLEENASLRDLQSSHNRILEQNQALMEKQSELMESNNQLLRQIVEMNLKFQELSTKQQQQQQQLHQQQLQQQQQRAAQQNTPQPDTSQAATITPNKPIMISAQMCKIESPNIAGMPSLVASPVHSLQGMYQHAYATPPAAYYPTHHGYAAAYGYDSAALQHSMQMAGTPTGRRGPVQSGYPGYDDMTSQAAENEMASNMALGRNMNQGVAPSRYASPLANLLVSQANQMQGQQSPKTVLVTDQNGATRVAAVPDVASRAAAAGSYFSNDSSALSPGLPGSSDRGISPVSPSQSAANNVGMSPAAKVAAKSPILKSMLLGDDPNKVRVQQAGSATPGTGVSPQQGSIASGQPVRPQPSANKPTAAASAQPIFGGFKPQTQQGQAASSSTVNTQSPQSFSFNKPVSPGVSAMQQNVQQPQQQQSFVFSGKPSPTPASSTFGQQPQASATGSGFGFAQASQPIFGSKQVTATTTAPSAISTFTFRQPSPQAASTPVSTVSMFTQPKPSAPVTATTSQSPFAGFSFSMSPAGAATTTSSSVQKPPAPAVFGQPAQKPVFGQPTNPAVPASGISFAKPMPTKPIEEDDVVLVSEKLPTAALQEKAKSLMLPPTFYNYQTAPPCPGCIGCHDDDVDIDKLIASGGVSQSVASKPSVGAAASNMFGSITGDAGPSDGGDVFGAAASGIDFAALATNTDSGFAKKDTTAPFAFAHAGAQIFGQGEGEHADGDPSQEYDPHYEAIVTLPEVVDLKTGHEEEEELYKQRCRLYRFDAEKNQWKERGVGDVKLMRHKETGRVRVVMRREQVHKVCANHTITPAMQLKALETSDRAWVYNAIDFSEGEASPELLAIKFKNPDVAQDFKSKFEECQVDIAELPAKQEVKVEAKPDKAKTDLMAKFAAKPGDWNCDGCYCRNSAEQTLCPACSTPKPGTKPTPAPTSGFKFAAQQQPQANVDAKAKTDLMAKFAAKPGEWNCDGCYCRNSADHTVCPACSTLKPGSKPAPVDRPIFGGFKKPDADLMAKFKPKPGEWKCDGCLCQNDATMMQCPACGTPQPGATGAAPSAVPSAQPSGSQGFKPTTAMKPSGFSFGSTSAASGQPSSGGGFKPPASLQPVGFSFGGGQQATTPVKQTASSQDGSQQGTPVTTPGGTPTTRFSFDASDSRNTGLPQFNFGQGNQEPAPTNSSSFVFGVGSMPSTPERGNDATPTNKQTSPSQYPFTQALQSLSTNISTPGSENLTSSFSEMAQTQGSTFSFRMDIGSLTTKPSPPKPQKSPGLLRSPGLIRSPGGDGDYYTNEEGDDIHFDPIVQLPDQVELKTGEEDESVVFSHRCKLFRFDRESSQWKERGLGDIKLLHNPTSNRYRIVMRRDQVFRVCANHFLNESMKLSPNAGSDRSWVWQAMDASDGEPVPEQLAVRFKAPETAAKFKDVFEAAVENLQNDAANSGSITAAESSSKSDNAGSEDSTTPETSDVQSSEISSSSEPKEAAAKKENEPKPMPKVESAFSEIFKNSPTPVASPSVLSAVSGNAAEPNPEEEREIHFEPIAKLPDKVDLQTGEENEAVLFCSRSKLYRFDMEGKAWKDRGVGDVKILSNQDTGRFRVIMRREQVLKVCANHYISADMKLAPNAGSKNSWVWLAMDAAEGEPQFEQLAIKFKLEETALLFKQVFEECQSKLEATDEETEEVIDKEETATTSQAAPSSQASESAANQPSATATPDESSTLGGGPVASPSDAPKDKAEAVGLTLGASPDVIPKSTASPSPELAPKATGTSLVSLLKDTPIGGLFGSDKAESGSDTTTTTTSSSSTSHSTSDNEEEEEEVEEDDDDDVGISNV